MTVVVDGSYGEGGGQVVRTALALSAITGQPLRIDNIRARRAKPGLAPQHLTAVRAAAAVCAAEVRGAVLRSLQLEFAPRSAPRAGAYVFDVTDAAEGGGSAGAATLVAQTVLLPLALAAGSSSLEILGGTHVPWSPPFHYFEQVYLPALATKGIQARAALEAWGFYPAGGGRMRVEIAGGVTALRPVVLLERGALDRVTGVAIAASLPAHIAQRMAARANNVLTAAGLRANVQPARVRSPSPGAGIVLVGRYAGAVVGFSALGAPGKPSEAVADEACRDLLAYHRSTATADMHLADQLLLPMALADGTSELTTCRVSQHLLTNARVIRQFLPAQIEITGREGEVGHVRVMP